MVTQPRSSAGTSPPSRWRGIRLLLLGAIGVAVLVGAATLWYFFFRPAGPPAIGTSAPVIPAGAVTTAAPSSSSSIEEIP
jgi:hypothetical protein